MQALSRNSDVFAAGVANAPVFNWVSWGRFDGDSAPFELAAPTAITQVRLWAAWHGASGRPR